MRRNVIETVMGGVVLIVAGFFLFFAYTAAGIQGQADGKEYWGQFHNIGGLQVGADVKIAGIHVGSVVRQELVNPDLLPVVHIRLSPQVELTKDALAKVVSEGLLGGTYLSLEQGKSDAVIAADGEIKRTEGPFGLEQIIGEFIFSKPEADE